MRIGIDGRLIGFKEGVGRCIVELTSQMCAIEPGNEYIVYTKSPVAAHFFKGAIKQENLRCVPIVGTPFLLREQIDLIQKIHTDQLDLFHATFDHGTPLYASCKVVLTVHDAWLESKTFFRSDWTRRYYQFMTRRGLRKAFRVVTVSNFVKQKILDCCPWMRRQENKIRVVPNGVGREFSAGTQPCGPSSLLEKYGVEKYLLYVGVLAKNKNIFGILESYALLYRQYPHVPQLVVAGKVDLNLADPLRFAEMLGIEKKVLFLGYVPNEELPALYRGAELFLFPSFHEGFGIPILEAMACGTPVITSTVAAMPEVAGDAALLVDPTRHDEIQSAMAKILFDPVLRRTLSERGIRRAEEFNWNKTARKVLEIYREVCEEN